MLQHQISNCPGPFALLCDDVRSGGSCYSVMLWVCEGCFFVRVARLKAGALSAEFVEASCQGAASDVALCCRQCARKSGSCCRDTAAAVCLLAVQDLAVFGVCMRLFDLDMCALFV
jgi:hypothetical protein